MEAAARALPRLHLLRTLVLHCMPQARLPRIPPRCCTPALRRRGGGGSPGPPCRPLQANSPAAHSAPLAARPTHCAAVADRRPSPSLQASPLSPQPASAKAILSTVVLESSTLLRRPTQQKEEGQGRCMVSWQGRQAIADNAKRVGPHKCRGGRPAHGEVALRRACATHVLVVPRATTRAIN